LRPFFRDKRASSELSLLVLLVDALPNLVAVLLGAREVLPAVGFDGFGGFAVKREGREEERREGEEAESIGGKFTIGQGQKPRNQKRYVSIRACKGRQEGDCKWERKRTGISYPKDLDQ
jgi:hypothetical protein